MAPNSTHGIARLAYPLGKKLQVSIEQIQFSIFLLSGQINRPDFPSLLVSWCLYIRGQSVGKCDANDILAK